MATKPNTKAPAPPAEKPERVTVKVLAPALSENGVTYFRDAEFQTTAVRAAALGPLVEIVPG